MSTMAPVTTAAAARGSLPTKQCKPSSKARRTSRAAPPWTGILARPSTAPEYHDIAVVAIPETTRSKYKIPDFIMKALQWKTWVAYRGTRSAPIDAQAPSDAIIPLDHIVDLTSKMSAGGALSWDAPAGDWTILRFGHAWNGHVVGPSPAGENGPETDKLDKSATDLHFNAFVKRLNELAGADGKGTLVATHIDSWEGGGQDWTAAMRDEFKKRRGYDPIPYLPILTNRVLGDLQITERFLWDLRKTVSELMIENYTTEFQRLAHDAGLRNSFESYTTIGNDLDNADFVDEPMAEFWTPNGQGADFFPTIKSMSSAAHINSRLIVGAESFTSGSSEKWLWHPAMIKKIGDEAFCQGVTRFVVHRYAAQRFLDPRPGMQMGPWGLHYERTNTWWEWSGPWHTYIARCQYLLRQGDFVADVLNVMPDEPLLRFQVAPLKGYDYDVCGPETFQRVTVRDGKLTFPNGRQYRLLTLTPSATMTAAMLAHLRDLVRDGAAILGDPPQATPGLTDYPKADADLKVVVDQLWGTDASAKDHRFGKGHVFRGISAEEALAALSIQPDFTAPTPLNWIHHTVGNADIYFVANHADAPVTTDCTFRVAGKQPESWDPETGHVSPLVGSAGSDNTTRVNLTFAPSGSAFIVFKPGRLLSAPAARKPPVIQSTPVAGAWKLRFPAGSGAPLQVELDKLLSWSQHPDKGVQYFSGTATYSKTLSLPALRQGERFALDLGKVQVMAKVTLNGKDLGILWKPPYRVDITPAVKPGDNALEIAVVNLWPNRLIGDEQLAEDSDRNKNGTLKSWPQWLLDGKPSPTAPDYLQQLASVEENRRPSGVRPYRPRYARERCDSG